MGSHTLSAHLVHMERLSFLNLQEIPLQDEYWQYVNLHLVLLKGKENRVGEDLRVPCDGSASKEEVQPLSFANDMRH